MKFNGIAMLASAMILAGCQQLNAFHFSNPFIEDPNREPLTVSKLTLNPEKPLLGQAFSVTVTALEDGPHTLSLAEMNSLTPDRDARLVKLGEAVSQSGLLEATLSVKPEAGVDQYGATFVAEPGIEYRLGFTTPAKSLGFRITFAATASPSSD